MKQILGLLSAVCAVALVGCTSNQHNVSPGASGTANASGAVGAANVNVASNNAITVNSASHAIDDPTESVTFTYDTKGTADRADDTATVAVTNGGQTAGPTNYVFDPTSHFRAGGRRQGEHGRAKGAKEEQEATRPPAPHRQ